MDGLFALQLNALLYILTFVVYFIKKRTLLDLGAICLLTFMLSSIGSVWYYSFDIVPKCYPYVSVNALVYIYCLFLIFLIPFLILKIDNTIIIYFEEHENILNMLSSFFAVIVVPVFLNLVFNFIFKSFSGNALNSMYENDVDNATLIFMPGIKVLYSLMRYFYDLIALLFCYNLIKVKNNTLIIGLGLSLLSFFMVAFQSGSRGAIVMRLITLGAYIILFYRLFNKDVKRYVRVLGLSMFVVFSIGLSAISISRFAANDAKGSDRVIDQWIAQYLGEGMIRFSHGVYTLDRTLDGDKNFSYFKSLLGNPSYDDNAKANLKYEARLGIPTSVFYTFVGSFYLDFGFIGTFVFACLVCLFISRICYKINYYHHIGFVSCLILVKYFKMISTGFTSNVYAVTSVQKGEFFFWLLIIAICCLSSSGKDESTVI